MEFEENSTIKLADSNWLNIYTNLKENITYFNLRPGEQINESAIASKFKISRTPVRTALAKLVLDGLVTVYPQKGSIVSKINLKLIREYLFTRSSLELAVMQIAMVDFPNEQLVKLEENLELQKKALKHKNIHDILTLDSEMHKIIYAGCGYGSVWDSVKRINSDIDRLRYLKLVSGINGSSDSSISAIMDWTTTLQDHFEYLKYIKKQKTKDLMKFVKLHVEVLLEDARILSTLYPDYFIFEETGTEKTIFYQ
ncbi:MAG: GntR family transcriptional regulator [Clostridiaceae bacterium]